MKFNKLRFLTANEKMLVESLAEVMFSSRGMILARGI